MLGWVIVGARSLKQESAARHVAPLDKLFWIVANQFLPFLLSAACLAANTSFIVFSLTRPRLEHHIYRTQGEHAIYASLDVTKYRIVVRCELVHRQRIKRQMLDQPSNFNYIAQIVWSHMKTINISSCLWLVHIKFVRSISYGILVQRILFFDQQIRLSEFTLYNLCLCCSFLWVYVPFGGERLLFNANSAIFQLYHGENRLIFIEMMIMMRSPLF